MILIRYFDIHVKYGDKDKDGFSVPVAINGNVTDAVKKALIENMIDECDVANIDNITEIDKAEYIAMIK